MSTTLLEGRRAKEKCELIYFASQIVRSRFPGRQNISDVSWRKWKRKCRVPPSTPQRGDWLTEQQVKKLICLAYLKARNPDGDYSYGDILKELYNPDPDWQTRLNAIAYAPTAAIISPAYGKELPKLIQRLTGCDIQLESIEQRIRRAAKKKKRKFSTKTFYSADQVNWWISVTYPDSLVAVA